MILFAKLPAKAHKGGLSDVCDNKNWWETIQGRTR